MWRLWWIGARVSSFPHDHTGAHEVAPPDEADETNEVQPAAGHDEPLAASGEQEE